MFAWPSDLFTEPMNFESRAFRQTLGGFCTGVCLVTTVTKDDKREGMTINSFSSVSLSPPLVLWSIREAARSVESFLTAPFFVISVLAQEQNDLAQHFARPAADKFERWEDQFESGMGGCPRLRGAVATFECRLYSSHLEGDHYILVGQVLRFASEQRQPLAFFQGRMGSMAELSAPHQAALKAA